MVIAGCRTVDPAEREIHRADSVAVVEGARRAPGALDCAIGADLVDPGAPTSTSAGGPGGGRGVPPERAREEQEAAMLSASVADYDVAGVRSLT